MEPPICGACAHEIDPTARGDVLQHDEKAREILGHRTSRRSMNTASRSKHVDFRIGFLAMDEEVMPIFSMRCQQPARCG